MAFTPSSANRFRLSYVEEATAGTTPATPTMSPLRVTSSALAANKQTVQSGELRADRMAGDDVEVARTAGGNTAIELSLGGDFDVMLAAAMGAADPTKLAATGVSVTDTSTFTAAGAMGNAVVGQYVKAAGFTDPANNGWFRVTAADANTVTVNSTSLVVEGAGGTLKGGMIRNGAADRSFSIEQAALDIDSYELFTGQRVSQLDLTFDAGAIVTGALNFMGTTAAVQATPWGSSYDASTGAAPVNAADDVGSLLLDGAALANTALHSLSLTVNNNLRNQPGIGSVYPYGIGYGRCQVSGRLQAYFASLDLYNSFLTSDATVGLEWSVDDSSGNGLHLYVPRAKLSGRTGGPGGTDQDVMEDFTWTAQPDAGNAFSFQLDIT